MAQFGVHEAKTHFSQLLLRVAAGEGIVITRGREPVARLVPIEASPKRRLGFARDEFKIPDDFDAPLPDEILDDFYS